MTPVRVRRPVVRTVGLVAVVTALLAGGAPAAASHRGPGPGNGGFEHGMTGWRTAERGNPGDGWSAVGSARAPVSGYRIQLPSQGEAHALVDQAGPGSHVLYRDLHVTADDLDLVMTLWYRNRAETFHSPATLHAGGRPNQQLRIDLLRPDAPVRSLAPGDVLATLFRTGRLSPFVLPRRVLRYAMDDFEGQTVRLRIAEVDNQNFFHVAVDAVRLVDRDDDTVALEATGGDGVVGPAGSGARYGR